MAFYSSSSGQEPSMAAAAPAKWHNMESAFPPFVPGAPLKSVYERAGFDVNKEGEPSNYAPSIRSHSRMTSRSPSVNTMRENDGPQSRSSSSLSNYRSQTPNRPLRPYDEESEPAHARSPAKEYLTTPDSGNRTLLSLVPPGYNPSRSRSPKLSAYDLTEQQLTSSEPHADDALPSTPIMTVPPPLVAPSSHSRNESPNTSKRSSDASSVYSTGYDPLYDLSPRYDRTKSLLPYQREQLEQGPEHPQPTMPPLEEALNRAQWRAHNQHLHQQQHQHPNQHREQHGPIQEFNVNSRHNARFGNTASSSSTQDPQFREDYSDAANNNSNNNNNPNNNTLNSSNPPNMATTLAHTHKQQQQHRPQDIVSRSGSLASTASWRSKGATSPRTPDVGSMTMALMGGPGGSHVSPNVIIHEEDEGKEDSNNYNNKSIHATQHDHLEKNLIPPPQHKRRKSKKGPCRGCGEIILGKSVSSRDGQLSGRWHKECFCCAKCGTRDFQRGNKEHSTASVEFYILMDMPLCHQCYHEENNSVCPMCVRGIEGECLDDGISRYHLACLRCTDCSTLLDPRVGFLSVIDGVFYCPTHAEYHAARAAALLPARSNSRGEPRTTIVERRRTQLMMM